MKRKGRRRRILQNVLVAVFLFALFCAGAVGGMIAAYSQKLPDISTMADYQPARSTRIFARDGTLLASVYKENRVWVPISQIPPVVQDAVIANEDHNFYQHHGIDFGGIARAAFADVTHQPFQGASTITQQLARKLFLNDQVSISRKIQEALLAIEIERYYTKPEILERYLNLVYLGSGAYGVDAASHVYFGRSVRNLTLGQAATLAGVIAAPSDYSPYVNPQLARERQRHVLDRMVESGFVTQAEADAAASAPLGLAGERLPGLQGYLDPYFTTYIIAQLNSTFGPDAVQEGGLQVNTTVDPKLEKIAQEAVDWGVRAALAEGINAHQAALVSIRPSTGEIVAMIGGTKFSLQNQYNRAWQARRQPGSSFKAYVYTAAIDDGMYPTSVIDDTPISYPMGDGTNWSPKDDDFRYMGAITLRRALALSRNVVAVKLADQIGVDRVIEYAHSMGVQAPLEANLSLALGSSVISVLDQASGYQTLANQGVHIDPTGLRFVKDSMGNTVLDAQYPQATDVVSAGTAYIMTSMLQDVIAYGTGTNANIGRPAAGKTGTTSDFRDAWFIGYTPDLVTAVWIGNDNYSRMYESYGGNIPARIWARYMKAALQGVPKHDFSIPADQVERMYCPMGTDFYMIDRAPPGCRPASSNWKSAQAESKATPTAAETIPMPTAPPAPSMPTVSTPEPSPTDEMPSPLPSVDPLPTESPR